MCVSTVDARPVDCVTDRLGDESDRIMGVVEDRVAEVADDMEDMSSEQLRHHLSTMRSLATCLRDDVVEARSQRDAWMTQAREMSDLLDEVDQDRYEWASLLLGLVAAVAATCLILITYKIWTL